MAILEEIKSAAKVIQQIDNIELYQKILDIQGQALSLLEEVAVLKKENNTLRDSLEIKDKKEFDRGAYWISKSDEKEGPYCTRCWDVDNKQVRMRIGDYIGGWAICPHCSKCAIK